ncbi:helix-turn-helix domain-containing protein [Pseudaestuariivita sp.]|uniref:helix-turn-helix domain-containing protein n=1 Tax=Pseudaestuariivita sp. TaxID=2211669 RepID=UPI004059E84A
MFDAVALGRLIKSTRAAQGLTQGDLAAAALGSPERKGDISRLENARTGNPQEQTVQRVAAALALPPAEIDATRVAPGNRPSRVEIDALIAERDALQAELELRRSLVVALAYTRARVTTSDFDAALAALDAALLARGASDAAPAGGSFEEAAASALATSAAQRDTGDVDGARMTLITARDAAEDGLDDLLTALGDLETEAGDLDAAAAAQVRRARLDVDAEAPLIELLRDEIAEAREQGTSQGLALAEALCRQTLPLCQTAEDHSAVLIDHGLILRALGRVQQDEAMLSQAVAALEAAIEDISAEDTPDLWAEVHVALGRTLLRLGEANEDIAMLGQAANAYQSATRVWTRDAAPAPWAQVQTHLANLCRLQTELSGNRAIRTEGLRHSLDAIAVLETLENPEALAEAQTVRAALSAL